MEIKYEASRMKGGRSVRLLAESGSFSQTQGPEMMAGCDGARKVILAYASRINAATGTTGMSVLPSCPFTSQDASETPGKALNFELGIIRLFNCSTCFCVSLGLIYFPFMV